jgi:putative two-component system response regulator
VKAQQALGAEYRVVTFSSAEKMFALLDKLSPDLILLDIEMPGMDGFSAIRQLKENSRAAKIPVVFLTAHTDEKIETQGFELGAVDFVAKPFSAPVLLNRIRTHLNIDALIKKRTERIEQLYNGILSIVANMVENRDAVTGCHVERTSKYLEILISAMLEKGVYKDEIKSWDLQTVVSSARLHDIGKITVRDAVLNKPGKLTPEEFDEIRNHTTEGVRMIEQIIAIIGDESFLSHAKAFAGCHHERWDGKGYPQGLKENEIPLQGRIMAIADVYDALVSARPYKEAFSCEKAEQIIKDDAGIFFDPLIVEVFYEKKKAFAEITVAAHAK